MKIDAEKKKNQVRLLWNAAQLTEFDVAERVGQAAKNPVYAGDLKSREVTAAHAETLLALVRDARNLAADAVQTGTEAQISTKAEGAERRGLLESIREVQAAARQKYASTNKLALRDYGVGTRLTTRSFESLTGIADAIREKLSDDALPGITAERLTAFTAALDAYKSADGAHGTKRSNAIALRERRDETLKAVKAARRTIQFAADAAWPYSRATSQEAREAFQLPPRRPFVA